MKVVSLDVLGNCRIRIISLTREEIFQAFLAYVLFLEGTF